jgi:hypothetical protein
VTRLRNEPEAISNFFDALLDGIGRAGSSFTNLDACTHDERTDRFLFQEFKRDHEPLSRGVRRLLVGLARREYLTVWCVRVHTCERLEFFDVGTRHHDFITAAEYQARFRRWWHQQPILVSADAPSPMLTAEEIRW